MSESVHPVPTFIRRPGARARRRAARPTAREWARHVSLFLLTALTTTWAGVTLMIPAGDLPDVPAASPATALDYIVFIPVYVAQTLAAMASYALAHPSVVAEGATFSGALLAILLAHEAGHYVACRLYGVDATLPYFIPAPPFFLAGTFGAFIKIKSPIPTRRALFDIGVAGPLAGFAVVIPVAVAALLTARPDATLIPPDAVVLTFNDPPLLKGLAWLLGVRDLAHIAANPFYFAAWVGLLVTSLNLLPVGQLDGGHATYALFGARAHARLGRAAFLLMLVLAPLGLLWHGAPSGFVYVLLLLIMLRVRHPEAEDEFGGMGRARTLVALITLVVFALSFTPFPLTLT